MTINGHFLLLVLATGLFARLWSTNDRQRPAAAWRTPTPLALTLPPAQPFVADDEAAAPTHVTSGAQSAEPAEEVWTAATCPVPLPATIAAGVYRVVDDSGRIARLELTSNDACTSGDAQPGSSDFHATTVGLRRWYFIRLSSPLVLATLDCEQVVSVVQAPSNPCANPTHAVCTNRKFDFSGYAALAVVIASPSTAAFQPEPPALPAGE